MTAGGAATATFGCAARICSLSIRDFRNLERVELEAPAAGLVLVGENGQGKTNLLEAVYYLQLMRSVRGARDIDVVRFGTAGFHLGANVVSDRASEIGVGFERAGKRKRVRLDGSVCERLSDAVGAVPAVMFSPADLELIAGSPTARRRYLDIMLAVTSRGYLRALQRYRAALVRRNAALREAARRGIMDPAGIEVWEHTLAEEGAILWRERRAWVAGVNDRLTALCRGIGEAGAVAIRYASGVPEASQLPDERESLARTLEAQRGADVRFGLTRHGPHRDDLVVTLAGPDGVPHELRVFGSAGQQRTAAIALRLLEAETLRDRRGGAPVVLLDDPFAELDVRRTQRIVDVLANSGLGQTMLAVPRESDIPSGMPRLERFEIAAGVLRQAS